MSLDIAFSLVREGSEVTGLTLVAGPQAEARIFCSKFPGALVQKEATIELEAGKVVFQMLHLDNSIERCDFEVDENDLRAIKTILEGIDPKGVCDIKHSLTPGFRVGLIVPEMLWAGGRVPDPSKKVKIIIEPRDGFEGAECGFDVPCEPICALVANTLMMSSRAPLGMMVISDGKTSSMPEFDITGWDRKKRELRVKFCSNPLP